MSQLPSCEVCGRVRYAEGPCLVCEALKDQRRMRVIAGVTTWLLLVLLGLYLGEVLILRR